MLRTLADANAALAAYVPTTSMAANYTLERMHLLLAHIGSPQEKLRVVHIAGTSGKTSTAYFIRGLLQAAGQRTGLTITPHMSSITERVQINGQPLPDKQFVAYLGQFLSLVESATVRPTYYELLIAFAFWVFTKESVDYAVIETGLGGLLDATNTILRPDKLCVITDIGLDHTEILGNTLAAIAAQKAGIAQPGNHVVMHAQAAVRQVIADVVSGRGAQLKVVRQRMLSAMMLPYFQKRNYSLALAAYSYLANRDGLPALSQSQLAQVAILTPPGRLEVIQAGGKTVILDGAHNPQKLRALRRSLIDMGIGELPVLANFVAAPPPKITAALFALRPFTTQLVIPEFVVHQDFLGRPSVTGNSLAIQAKRLSFKRVDVVPDLADALARLLACSDSTVLITGSLHLVGQARAMLKMGSTR
jgi:dihydrofolate synthase/folylpolyglutamate synthase